MLKSAIMSYFFVSPEFVSRPFCSHVALLQNGASLGAYFVDFKMNVIKLKFVRFCNHTFDFRPNCTPLSAITIIKKITLKSSMVIILQ